MIIKSLKSIAILLVALVISETCHANSLLSDIFPEKEMGLFHVGYNRLKGDEFNFRWSVASYTYSNNYVGLEFPTVLVSSYYQPQRDNDKDDYVSDNYIIALSGWGSMAFFRVADKLMGTEGMSVMGDFLGSTILAITALPNTRLHLKYLDFPLSAYAGLNTQVFLEERTRILYIVPEMVDFLVTQETGIQYRFLNMKFKIYMGKRIFNMTELEVPSSYFGTEIYTFIDWNSFLNR